MNDFTLYQIKSDYILIEQIINDCNEDELKISGLLECLDQVKDAFNDKAVNVAKIMRNLQSNADAVKNAAKALTEKAKRIEAKVEYLSKYLRDNMLACDIKRINSPELTVSLRPSAGRLIIDDESKIPSEYITHKEVTSVDKNRLKADFLGDNLIHGCHIDFTPTLQVK